MASILPVTTSPYIKQPIVHNRPNTVASPERTIEQEFPWVKDKNLLLALNELKQIKFLPEEIDELKKVGVRVPFNSGAEAVKFLHESNTRIVFDSMDKEIHAQYDFNKNFIKINKIYKNTMNTAEILAIAEAILHEAGHAKDKDGESSVQEEINCLGTNALAHRDLKRRYPHMFRTSEALIVQDGVRVYERLFFDNDTEKKGLVKRLQLKYGYLPAGDVKHQPSALAIKVKGLNYFG